jgi:hypothetical protein
MRFPLASSYNQRGGLAYANAQAGKDQRKVNCVYDVTQNALSGRQELILAKRPGITKDSQTLGANTQVPYLMSTAPGAQFAGDTWLYVKDSNAIKACNSSTATTVLSSANHVPAFVSVTTSSAGTVTAILQLVNNVTSGVQAQRVYFSTAIGTWTEITTNFDALLHMGKMEFLGGKGFILDTYNRIHNSGINDLPTWDTSLNYTTRSIVQDVSVGLARHKKILLAFGRETVEGFIDAGNPAGSPLSRIPEITHNIGMAVLTSRTDGDQPQYPYYCNVGEKMYFIGREAGGNSSKSLFAFDGGRFERVPKVDRILSSIATIYGIHAVEESGRAAVAILTTAPGSATAKWLMFYPEFNDYFEWESAVFSPVNAGPWFVGAGGASYCHKRFNFAVSNNWQDDATDYQYLTQFRVPVADGQWHTMWRCGVDADTAGTALALNVATSKDDFTNFVSRGDIDLSQVDKYLGRGCGMFKSLALRLSYTGSQDVRIREFYASVT